MYRLPGLSHRATEHLLDLAAAEFVDWHPKVGRRKALDWPQALRLCLTRLRQNLTFEELGEIFGVSDSVACDYFHHMTAFLADAIGCPVQDLKGHVKGKICLVDGTLVPTWNWRHRKDLYSGKHKRYGVNVQVVGDLHARLDAVSKAYPGSWHDKHAYDQADLDTILADAGGKVGDPGYQGTSLTTPDKKPPGGQLSASQRRNNKSISKIRVGVEWVIAHLKNWRILTTRYRGEINHRLDNVILATAGLQKLNEQFSTRKLTFKRFQQKDMPKEAVSG